MKLPTDAEARKNIPLFRGLFKYFPRALCSVAELSRIASGRHNPGEPMHWAREKSPDHEDCLLRHMLDLGHVDTDGVRHATKVSWRALAILELELEAEEEEAAWIKEQEQIIADWELKRKRVVDNAVLCKTDEGDALYVDRWKTLAKAADAVLCKTDEGEALFVQRETLAKAAGSIPPVQGAYPRYSIVADWSGRR